MQVWLIEADKICSEIQKIHTALKMKFSIKDFFSKCEADPKPIFWYLATKQYPMTILVF